MILNFLNLIPFLPALFTLSNILLAPKFRLLGFAVETVLLIYASLGPYASPIVLTLGAHHQAYTVVIESLQLVSAKVALHYFDVDHVLRAEVHRALRALTLFVTVNV